MATHFATLASARQHFKDLVDAAVDGRPATLQRSGDRVALVDAERLRVLLASFCPAAAEIVAEAGHWSAFIPGLPISGSGSTYSGAVDDVILALRDYAADWTERLRFAPNHASNWAVVQLLDLSTDEQLRAWLTVEAPE